MAFTNNYVHACVKSLSWYSVWCAFVPIRWIHANKNKVIASFGVNAFLTSDKQAFSQDAKSGRQNCTIGPAQMNNL